MSDDDGGAIGVGERRGRKGVWKSGRRSTVGYAVVFSEGSWLDMGERKSRAMTGWCEWFSFLPFFSFFLFFSASTFAFFFLSIFF